MRGGRFDFSGYDRAFEKLGLGTGDAPGLSLKPSLPQSTDKIVGIDLTHIIHTSEVAGANSNLASAKPGGGGGTTFPNYTAGPADGSAGYNITIEFKGTGWTQAYYDIFKSAADKLTALIIGELPNVTVYGGKGGPKVVDDILITAELGAIDGLYGILGQAGPTSVRSVGSLPATAQMKFDIADVNAMALSVFSEVILHEMSHSLGFGSIWDRLGLVSNGQFTGANAAAEFHQMGGTGFIPVEQDGGSGTAGSHWDEETFHNELMTGYINDGVNPFSEMSAASFADLGYKLAASYPSWVSSADFFV